jgi:hypothetical protein
VNYLQLVQRLHREAGRSGSGPASSVGASKDHMRLFDWLADELLKLESRPIEWKWMRRSLVGPTAEQLAYTGADLGAEDFGRWREHSDEYDVKAYLPADPGYVWRLHFMALEDFKTEYYDRTSVPGRPLNWSISDTDELLIGPISDVDYMLKADYQREPQVLALDADEPSMPKRHHLLLMWGALRNVGKYDNAPETLARAMAEFGAMEGSLLEDQGATYFIGAPLV